MTSIRGEAGRFTTLSISLETSKKVRQLAGDRPVYRVIDELVDMALAGKQSHLGGGVSGGGSGKQDDGLKAKLTRIFGSERGQDVLRKAEALHYDDEKRAAMVNAILYWEEFGGADKALTEIQQYMALQLEGLTDFHALGVKIGKEERPAAKGRGLLRRSEG